MHLKEQLNQSLQENLGDGWENNFPTWLLDNDILTYVGDYNPILKRIQCQINRPQEKLLQEDKDVGNEQRGQSTDKTLGDNSKTKSKWDGVIYSAVAGNVEGGPLLSVIKGYGTVFYSDYLHRRIQNENVVNDEYIVTHEPEARIKNFFKGKNSIVNKPFSQWSQECKDNFYNTNVPSIVNIYTSDILTKNLEGKSMDFGHRNDNVSLIQKLHSVESVNNRHSKIHSGLRYSDYTITDNGEVLVTEEWDYEKIRKHSSFPLFRDKNLKGVTSDGRGYLPQSFDRNLNTGYKFQPDDFKDLKPYEIFHQMKYIWDKVNFKTDKLRQKDFVDMNWKDEDFIEWTKTRVFSDKELKDLNKRLGLFHKFYNRLQDLENVKVIGKSKLFQYERMSIISMWMIFNRFWELGSFFNYQTLTYNNYKSTLEYQIVKLLQEFKKMDKIIPDEDVLNYFSHRRSFGTKAGQYKTMKSFFKTFFEGEFTKNLDGDKWEWNVILKNYYKWTYKFIDPKVSFDKRIQAESYDKCDSTDWVTGKDVGYNETQGHHILYRGMGGSTANEDNCAMVITEYNLSLFNQYPRTSLGIEVLLQSPNTFIPKRRDYWEEGGLDELKEFEKDHTNYYWPTYE